MLTRGDQAPNIDLGNQGDLASVYGQGPVLLVFFKVSCPTCQFTLPYVNRLSQQTGNHSPRVIAISQDDAENTDQFKRRLGLGLQTWMDDPAKWTASNAYKITHVPSLFLIQQGGVIQMASEGFVKDDLETLGRDFGGSPFAEGEVVPAVRPG